MTTKISWNQYNDIQDDLFWWRGIDGTEILTYFIDVPVYAVTPGRIASTYGCSLSTRAVTQSWKAFKNKELTKDMLVSFGMSDGGGGVTRDSLEQRRVMDTIPGMPHVKMNRAGDFFRLIHEKVENTDRYVHTWDGELYLEYHRGTYTTQAYNKKTNRLLENKLAMAEWLSALAYLNGGDYAQKELYDSWECVLLHQFHDIIPGSSIQEVYEDSRINYTKAEDTIDKVLKDSLNVMFRSEDVSCNKTAYSVFSVCSFGGKELVHIPETADGYFVDQQGIRMEAQKCESGYDVLVDTVPFGAVTLYFVPAEKETPATPFIFRENGVETPYYSISWNDQGQICKLYDKEAERFAMKEGQLGNVLEFYEDKSMDFEAWDIDIYYTQKKPEIAELTAKPEVIENGALKAVVRFCYRYRDSAICQDMIVYKDSRKIDFKTSVDWQEKRKLFKAAFAANIRSTKATYDIQFGHAERPTHWNTSWDWAKFEVCGHKWADLSESGYGISLLNDCKYGYSIKDNVMKITLLRSAKFPDKTADMGMHEFVYSLLPHTGSVTEGGTIEESNRLNLPARVVNGMFAGTSRIVTVSNDMVQIDAVKKAEDEDCLIVRLHECRGGRGNVVLSSDFPVSKIVPCNMLEHDCGEGVEGNSVEFEVEPFEIKTYKLYL